MTVDDQCKMADSPWAVLAPLVLAGRQPRPADLLGQPAVLGTESLSRSGTKRVRGSATRQRDRNKRVVFRRLYGGCTVTLKTPASLSPGRPPRPRRACSGRSAPACTEEGALSFVTAVRYSIGILRENENWRMRMTEVPRLLRPVVRRHVPALLVAVLCPGRKPPFSAVKRPARPHESAIQNRFK